LLLIDDHEAFRVNAKRTLEAEGYDVIGMAIDGESGLRAARDLEPDLVLLDVGLPDTDGFTVCRELRGRSSVPIIILTAKGEEIDRVVGLEVGADDYIVKPFGFRELIARIRAVTRRTGERPTLNGATLGRLELDTRGRRIFVDGEEIDLTQKEFDLLALLASDPGAVFSRSRILEEVWQTPWFGSAKTIDVHVGALRKKLGDPSWIETVRGVGLRLHVPP
jgi:DNA-binding response OmpR family regulator